MGSEMEDILTQMELNLVCGEKSTAAEAPLLHNSSNQMESNLVCVEKSTAAEAPLSHYSLN